MQLKSLIAIMVTLLTFSFAMRANAAKADWPGKGGNGVIGFALVELTPAGSPGAYKPTRFQFEYLIPAKYQSTVQSGQIIAVPSKALEDYNEVPQSAFDSYSEGVNLRKSGDFKMTSEIIIDHPALYVIAYGPYDGLLSFDDADQHEIYKIAGRSLDGGSLKWIDEDAGDFTVFNFGDQRGTVLRIRMLRDKKRLLNQPMTYSITPLKLNSQALKRVNLLDANW